MKLLKMKIVRKGILSRFNKLEKSVLCAFLVAIIAMSATDYTAFAKQCSDIRQKVFRLHILANSDSTADQALKLKVRDKILEASGELFATTGGKTEAEAEAKANLDKLLAIAQQEVYQEGYQYQVKAAIVHMYFNTRTYGDVTLPAGDYDALRITIGAAKGHNWWCVLFPPLCFIDINQSTAVQVDGKPGIPINNKSIVSTTKQTVKSSSSSPKVRFYFWEKMSQLFS